MAVTITKGATLPIFSADRVAGTQPVAGTSQAGAAHSTGRLSEQVAVARPLEAGFSTPRTTGTTLEGEIRTYSEAASAADEVAAQIRSEEDAGQAAHADPHPIDGPDRFLV